MSDRLIFVKFNIVIMLIFVSCQKYEELKPMLNVYCVLKNSVPYQKVVVDRIYGMDEKSIYDLEGVQVILSGDGICDTLVEDSIYGQIGVFISPDSFPVVPGKTYYLQVSAKGFDTLIGITNVPDSFEIIYPENGDTISLLDTLLIIFKNKNNNQWALISGYYQDTMLFINSFESIEDTIWRFPIAHWGVDTGHYRILFSSVDTNFVDYHLYGNSDSIPQCGVENGIGLFGSLVTKGINFYLRY